MPINFSIKFAIDKKSVRVYDDEGRLHVEKTPLSKSNICPYIGEEIPDWEKLNLDPKAVYHLLRDPAELAKAVPTFNGIQLLQKHIPVSAEDPQQYDVVGCTGTDAEFKEPYLMNSITVWVQSAIDGIESGDKVQLSAGYKYTPVMESGVYKGEPYQGRMTQIFGNHISLVEEGRSGVDVRVLDSVNPKVGWAAIEAAILALKEPA